MNTPFIVEETRRNLQRHRLLTVAAVVTVSLALIVGGTAALVFLNLHHWARRAAWEFQVTAFLAKDTSREQADALVDTLKKQPAVAEVEFISREQAAEMMQERYHDLVGSLLESWGNPLPDAIRVRLKDPQAQPALSEFLRGLEGVEQVRDTPETAQAVAGLVKWSRWIGLGATGMMLLVALAIIHSTITLTIHARRREINIMQLVGASGGIIRGPFVLEGIFHGVAGGVIAVVVLMPAYLALVAEVAARTPRWGLWAGAVSLTLFALALIGAGAAMGWAASTVSVRAQMRRQTIW